MTSMPPALRGACDRSDDSAYRDPTVCRLRPAHPGPLHPQGSGPPLAQQVSQMQRLSHTAGRALLQPRGERLLQGRLLQVSRLRLSGRAGRRAGSGTGCPVDRRPGVGHPTELPRPPTIIKSRALKPASPDRSSRTDVIIEFPVQTVRQRLARSISQKYFSQAVH